MFLLQFVKGSAVMTMADNSTIMSEAGRSILVDCSILDSKVTETSQEKLLISPNSDGKANERMTLTTAEYG